MQRRALAGRDAAFIKAARVIRVATVGPDGTPHVVPVCHVLADGAIWFGTDATTRKVAHLRRNRRVSLVADHYEERWGRLRGVTLTGVASVVAAGPMFRRGVRLLYRKYPQYAKAYRLEPGESVIVRVRPTHVMSWDYSA